MSTAWDHKHMGRARYEATLSKDRSTKVGCVIIGPDNEVRSTGYNGFPRGCNDNLEERHERPEKYKWAEHAERNAIYNAARHGAALKGCRAYVSCFFPCMDCARGLVQSGITEIICEESTDSEADRALADRWKEDIERMRVLFAECGTTFRTIAKA